MNTRKVRYSLNMSTMEYSLSNEIKDIRGSVKAYMDWKQGSDNYDLNALIFQKNKELAKFYDDFVTQCVLDDIQDLKDEMKAREEK